MQVIVISESLIIRKGITKILSNESSVKSIRESHIFSDIYKEEYNLILIDLNKNNESLLPELQKIKENTNTMVMVLDFYENPKLFSKCMKLGIDGYILANINAEDMGYATKQLCRGKKYYDADLIENYLSCSHSEYIEGLTKREHEILMYIAKGKSNLEISKELFITEHTVKKHTSNILSKLHLKDRMQVALFAYDRGIIS